jgi:large subunit ribosomal protein L31
MKKDIHPKNYRLVIFEDSSNGAKFLMGSTIETTETGDFEGKQYPLTRVEISSASHPFYTGNEKVLDSAGRVEKFKARRASATSKTSTKGKAQKSKI